MTVVYDVLDEDGATIHQIDGGVAVRARIWGGGETFEPMPMTGKGRAAFDIACRQALAKVHEIWAARRAA